MAETQNLRIRPVEINVPVDNASDQSYAFQLHDQNGDEVDLRGYTAEMELRPYPRAKKVYDTLTTENGRLEVIGCTVNILFPAPVTAEYKFESAVYDLVIVSPSGAKFRVAQGVVRTSPQVTMADI